MKKREKFLSTMISIIVLNFFAIVPTTFAASMIEDVLVQFEVKEKVQNLLYDAGRKMIQNLSNSLSSKRESNGKEERLKGKKIILDPGHGGHNPGAVRYNLRESDNNLAVALKLKSILEGQGAQVTMTRSEDRALADKTSPLKDELQARVDIAHRNNADIFVSIHTNSNENTAINGAMTFYYNDASKKLAENVQNGMINATQAKDKGIDYGNFLVLRNNKVPAILVEMGFITNQEEALKLNENNYRAKMAVGIAEGIHDYFQKTL